MPMDVLFWLFPVLTACLYWYDTAAAKELAVIHSRKACKAVNVQFLDESVVRYRSALRRGYSGSLCLARYFRFEFTIDGQSRHSGYTVLLGKRLQMIDLDLPDPEHQSNTHHLFMTASYRPEESNALRPRIEKRPDCRS